MNKNIQITVILVFSIFLVSLASASKLYNTCEVYGQQRPGNLILFQTPHFTCCNGDSCRVGDGLRKHVNLEDVQNVGAHGEADIRVYNYNSLDKVNINLRTEGLPPNQLFNAWILQGDNSRSKIGAFKTNSRGRGQLVFKQTLSSDFNDYHTIIVEWGDPVRYLSANIDFTEAKIPFV